MAATILDGRALARMLREELRNEMQRFSAQYDTVPTLAMVQVQGDDASDRYAQSINKLCTKIGAAYQPVVLPGDVSQAGLAEALQRVSADPAVDGILIQLPLPPHLKVQEAVLHMDYRKDLDGIHPHNAGLLLQGQPTLVPNTPAGGMAMLQHYELELTGKHAVVVGSGLVVGRPMADMLLVARATVTICHSYTTNLAELVQQAEVLVVAAGQAGLVTGDMLRPGVTIIDFGINVQPDGSVVGDVDFASAVEVAGAITPVPGGTGPITNVMLLRNLLTAAVARRA
jgi:methylenetetrahydrofolate dehydrogenase (NADP+)/methenyltetrahydrofolate cyclohydrolase